MEPVLSVSSFITSMTQANKAFTFSHLHCPNLISLTVFYYILSNLFSKTMGCFSGCLMSSASDQKLFCGVCSAFRWSLDEFVGKKVVSLSYSSTIFSDSFLNQIPMDSHAWSQLLPWWLSGKESACQCSRRGLDTWVLGPRLLCPWNSPGRNTGVGSPLPSSGDLSDSGIEPVWATREAHITVNVLPKSWVCLTKSRRMAWYYLLTWGSHSSVPRIGKRIQLCKLRPDP